jgi:hypothetical protein
MLNSETLRNQFIFLTNPNYPETAEKPIAEQFQGLKYGKGDKFTC